MLSTEWAGFGGFRVHLGRRILMEGDRSVHLPPKSWELLALLLEREGTVIPKREVLDRLWPGDLGSEYAMSRTVRRLRESLGDLARRPAYFRTVHGVGFEWIAPLDRTVSAPGGRAPDPRVPVTSRAAVRRLVGRDREQAELRSALADVVQGAHRRVLVSGAIGTGKTALLDDFLAVLGGTEVQRSEPVLLVGRCLPGRGEAEPAGPLVAAIERLAATDHGRVVASLWRAAPSWLAQLPGLAEPAQRVDLAQHLDLATRPAMLRELAAFVADLSRRGPVVIVIDDLHWADPATLDGLDAIAAADVGRVAMVLAHRLSDTGTTADPVSTFLDHLSRRAGTVPIRLDPLSARDVERLVTEHDAATTRDERSLRQLAADVFRRSGGNPLFVTTFLDRLAAAGSDPDPDGGSAAAVDATWLGGSSLARLHEHQVAQLDPADLALLQAGSLVGGSWTAALVTASVAPGHAATTATGGDAERRADAQRRLDALASPGGCLSRDPDGGYAFVHDAWREAVRSTVSAARSPGLHRRIGEHLATSIGEDAGALAGRREIAEHLLLGGAAAAAVPHLVAAGWAFRRRFAQREALELFDLAVDALEDAGPDAVAPPIQLEARLGLALSQLFLRSRESARTSRNIDVLDAMVDALGPDPRWFNVWQSVLLVDNLAGRIDRVRAMAPPMLRMAEQRGKAHELMDAQASMGEAELHAGHPAEALARYEEAARILREVVAARPDPSPGQQVWARDSGMRIHSGIAGTALLVGALDRVHDAVRATYEMADDGPSTPLVRIGSFSICAATLWLAGDQAGAAAAARRVVELAEGENEDFLAVASAVLWACGAPGTLAERRAAARVLVRFPTVPYPLGLTVFLAAGLLPPDEALELLDDVEDGVLAAGSRWAEAELRRIRGELLLTRGSGRAEASADITAEAGVCFDDARRVAREQGADFLAARVQASRVAAFGQDAEAAQIT